MYPCVIVCVRRYDRKGSFTNVRLEILSFLSNMSYGEFVVYVGHEGSFTVEVRQVLFNISISRYQSSFDLYYHS